MYITPQMSLDELLLYLRKSQSDDPLLTVEEVLQKHEAILDEWCEANLGGKVPEENKLREVVSGETIDDRPQMLELLKRIESPRIKAVLVVEVQRLSRGDLEDAGRLIKFLRYSNTLVITKPDAYTRERTYDLRDEEDRERFERELKRGNEFLEYQKKIYSRGRLLSIQQGNFIGSIAPYGYDKTFVIDGKRKCPTLKINEKEANVVRMIFDMYVNKGYGYKKIANTLDGLGIKPRNGKHWSPAALKDTLANVHYIGKVRWNWRKTVKVVEGGEVIKMRPKQKIGEYLMYDGRHPAIIDEATFNASLERLGKNPRNPFKKELSNPYAGIIFCECGKAMVLRKYTNKGKEVAAPRLLCVDQRHCNTGSCLASEITDEIKGVLRECISNFELQISGDNKDAREMHNNLIKNLEKRLAELEKKELSLWDKYAEEGMPKSIFDKLHNEVLKEKEEVNKGLCEAHASMPEPVDYEKKLFLFRDALEKLEDENTSANEKNRLLKACIERITYKKPRPQRVSKSTKKRVGWTNPPIEIDVQLRV